MYYLTDEQKRRNAEIGRAVKAFLKERKISVNRLAQESCMRANNISRSLSGRYTMPKKVVDVLVEKYGFDRTFFDNGKEEATKSVLLTFPLKEYAALRFIAARKRKTVNALIHDAVREKYGKELKIYEKYENPIYGTDGLR